MESVNKSEHRDPQRVALVSGGSRGIGYEIARGPCRAGCDVILTARTDERADAAAQRLPSSVLEQPVEILRQTLEVNLIAPYRLIQLAVPLMWANGYGCIVNVSSGSGQLFDMSGEEAAYRISETGLNAVTRVFAAELEGTGILINSMCLGWVHTDMGGPEAPRTPEEGADTAVWLATLANDGPPGGFFRFREPIPW